MKRVLTALAICLTLACFAAAPLLACNPRPGPGTGANNGNRGNNAGKNGANNGNRGNAGNNVNNVNRNNGNRVNINNNVNRPINPNALRTLQQPPQRVR